MSKQALHLTDVEISKYINNQLDEYAKQVVELELEMCELCMNRFMELIDEVSIIAPIQDEQIIAEQVILQIKQQQPKKWQWIQRPFVQYAIAASVTLILTVTGLFGGMTEQLSHYEQINQSSGHRLHEEAHFSKSEQWLGKTTKWLEQIKAARFND